MPPLPIDIGQGLQCRAGIGRAGAYRAGYFTQNVGVTIGGTDWTSAIELGTLTINQHLNDQPDTCSFVIKPKAGFVPQPAAIVSISLGASSNPIFRGQILRLTEQWIKLIDGPARMYRVECIDGSFLFDSQLPVLAHYQNMSATAIAAAVMQTYCPYHFRDSIDPSLPTVTDFPVTNELPTAVLRRLVNLIDGGYFADAYFNVHLFGVGGDNSPKAGTKPQAISLTPQSFANSPRSLTEFALTGDTSQIRTRVIVEGKSTQLGIGTPSGSSSLVVEASTTVDIFVVGGGGAGGTSSVGGGGGGGGGFGIWSLTLGTGTYHVFIGAGGVAPGGDGGESSFYGLARTGGGGGANGAGPGRPGGCGGGGNGSSDSAPFSPWPGGAGASGQGYAGGRGGFEPAGAVGGGGGGAGGAGANAGVNGPAGGGGLGVLWNASGTNLYYGGGGGGRGPSGSPPGGAGGGGAAGVAGVNGYGGGGGAGAAGGSGVVILSYPDGAINATGGTITHVGGKTIHTFTATADFIVAAVVLTSPPPLVTDLPLVDATQIDPNPGTVRMGFQLFNYLKTAGPVVPSGANPPGSKLTADAAANATVINVLNASSVFTVSPGWAYCGGQYIRFTGASATQLTGIPALGFGAITNPLSNGSEITWASTIVIANAPGVLIDPPITANETVVQRIQVEDASAQSALAAIEGGNGVHVHYISDGRLSLAGMQSRANAELSDFRTILRSATWTTYDQNAERGRLQSITAASVSFTLLITSCTITFPKKNYPARRQCEGTTVRTAALLDAVVTSTT